VREDAIKVNQALINQDLTKTIKNQEDKSDGRKRASISRGEINTLVYISFKGENMRIIHKETSTHKRLIKRIHDIQAEVIRYTKKDILLKCIYSPWLYFILWYINELHQGKTKISKPSQLTLRELMLVGIL
jgi:hypothetical protein